MAAPRICRRLATPGFFSGSKTTSDPVSVTARLNLRSMAAGSSSTRTVPWGESADLDILAVGFWRSMTRAPTLGRAASGTTNVSP